MKTWTVVYRTGGVMNCIWRRTLAFPIETEAQDAKKEIIKGGRVALIFDTKQLDNIGMPVGWDADFLLTGKSN